MNGLMAEKRNNGATAAVGAVLGLLALIAGVYAMVQPMNQRIDFVDQQMEKLEIRLVKSLERHIETASHPQAARDLATMSERFKEVETQFRSLREVQLTKFQELNRRVTKSETDGNPRHDERIKNLERINGIDVKGEGK